MALSIGVSENSKIRVGNQLLRVSQIQDSRHIAINYGGKRYLITDAERTEVEKDVYISCGLPPSRLAGPSMSRLAFEAPRSIKISRVKENVTA